MRPSLEDPKAATLKLMSYCRANNWAGYDPYDGLNSKILERLPFLDFRVLRLVLIQLLKRSPVNFRSLLGVPKVQNPKAIALFLTALLKLSRLGLLDQEGLIGELAERLAGVRSQGTPYSCWGYSFPWQTRTILVPRGAPNLVCTCFAGNALLDAYERTHDPSYLGMAVSAAEYILTELYWTNGEGTAGFSYPTPSSRIPVHNANLLGAAFLCRVHKHSGKEMFLLAALSVARYSAAKQHENGSWDYGESSSQRWVDNFHTGYNLCALRSISQHGMTLEFEPNIRRGFEFYRAHFFRADDAPKYYSNNTYPIDIHSVAQSIITLAAFRDLDDSCICSAFGVYRWAMTNMWDAEGFFYYRVLRFCKIRTSYMRWSQAWMLVAMATLLEASTVKPTREVGQLPYR
jgi:hypothetical protein